MQPDMACVLHGCHYMKAIFTPATDAMVGYLCLMTAAISKHVKLENTSAQC